MIRSCSARAAAPDLYRELRTSPCPRPANRRPDEFTVGECVDARECGCSAGAAIAKSEGWTMDQVIEAALALDIEAFGEE